MNVLSISNLSKSFGQQQIIKDLNMSVPEGSVFGFIGQNGAGKTTTMKMVLGLLQPDQGEILVCNEPVRFGQTKTNQYIGYLPDVPEFYNYMTAIQYLTLCGEIVGLSKKIISQKGQRLLSLVGLDGVEKRIGGYSRGMKQRLGIAQALLADPKLLICDEPTSALDPVGRKEVLKTVQKLRKKKNVTVILITHYMEEVIDADKIYVMDHGHVVMEGTPREIFAQVDRLKEYRLDVPQVTILADKLRKMGLDIPEGILRKEELVEAVCRLK